jgi:hypothetical protein
MNDAQEFFGLNSRYSLAQVVLELIVTNSVVMLYGAKHLSLSPLGMNPDLIRDSSLRSE